MSRQEEHQDQCNLESGQCDDDDGLCCCYIIDEDGQYDDPCLTPVGEMCCC